MDNMFGIQPIFQYSPQRMTANFITIKNIFIVLAYQIVHVLQGIHMTTKQRIRYKR